MEEQNKKEETSKQKTFIFLLKNTKEIKEIKIGFGGSDTEKVHVPSYRDNGQDETLPNLTRISIC